MEPFCEKMDEWLCSDEQVRALVLLMHFSPLLHIELSSFPEDIQCFVFEMLILPIVARREGYFLFTSLLGITEVIISPRVDDFPSRPKALLVATHKIGHAVCVNSVLCLDFITSSSVNLFPSAEGKEA